MMGKIDQEKRRSMGKPRLRWRNNLTVNLRDSINKKHLNKVIIDK